jgi:hypothetical protein
MTNRTGRGAAFVAAIAAALMLALTGTAAAGEAHAGTGSPMTSSGCEGGQAVGRGATPINSFDFTVCRHGSDVRAATGYFRTEATAPANAVVAAQGPVTCADVRGNTASFYYPFGPGSKLPPNPAVTGIVIVAVDGGPTGDRIGFEPVLAGANADCSQDSPTVKLAVASALVPVTSGSISVSDHA